MTDTAPREVEAALLVRSDAPEEAVERIASLPRLGEYELVPRADEAIRDRYYDTPRGGLGGRGLALRVREIDGARWIALKGSSEGSTWADRPELELPWGGEAADRVLRDLEAAGALLPTGQGSESVDSEAALAARGLAVVQVRETRRRPRDVVASGGGGPALAELAVDTVMSGLALRLAHRTGVVARRRTAEPGGKEASVEETVSSDPPDRGAGVPASRP